jgi:hypothetical protein
MIDREYNKVIVLCYPQGAGGNFLINCLSLSDQCVLRDAILAEQQLSVGIDVEKKLIYLQSQLATSKRTGLWNDLALGCANLFGIPGLAYLEKYPEIIQKQFNYVIPQLIKQQKYLFIIAHSTQYLDAYCKFWTNARVIFMTEYHEFVQRRYMRKKNPSPMLLDYWNTVKGPNWPVYPPMTNKEFLLLPKLVQTELVDNFHSEIFKWIDIDNEQQELYNCTVNNYIKQMGNCAFEWNVSTNFSGNQERFLETLDRCSTWAGINIEAADNDITEYYKNWLDAIFTIQHSSPGDAQV